MAQDLKISELIRQALNIDTQGSNIVIDPLVQSNKYIVPAYIPGEGNKSLDLGLMFNIIKLYVDQAAQDAVQQVIDEGGIDSGGSSGGTSADVTQLQNQITELRTAVYNPSNYPVTYIKLTNGTQNSLYQIVSGIGQASPYTENNPITITTSSITPDNFYVTIQPTTYTSSGTATVQLTIDGGNPYAGGTIGTIIVKAYFTTSNGQYEATKVISDFVDTTLDYSNPSIPTQTFNISTTIPSNASISQVAVTCSVSGKELGTSGVNIGGSTISVGIGTIKL